MKKFLSAKSGFVLIRSNHFRVTCTAFFSFNFPEECESWQLLWRMPSEFSVFYVFAILCSIFSSSVQSFAIPLLEKAGDVLLAENDWTLMGPWSTATMNGSRLVIYLVCILRFEFDAVTVGTVPDAPSFNIILYTV